MMKHRLQWALPAIALAIAAGLAGCSSEPSRVEAAPETVTGYTLIKAGHGAVPNWLEAVGTVQAAQSSRLSSQVMGYVTAVNVHVGDRVRRGQVLARIDDTQPRAALDRANAAVLAAEKETAAAEADHELAEATLRRYQALLDKKSVSPQEFDEVKARQQGALARREMARAGVEQAKAAQAQARTQLDYTEIRAPFDGVVTDKPVDPGVLASPGLLLVTVEDTSHYRLEASVDESEIGLARLGGTVDTTLDALPGKQFSARVAEIVPAADPASRSFTVKLELPPNPAIRSGLFGRAHFPRGQRQALTVPRPAIVDRGQLQGVYVVGQDKVANLRYVTLGKSLGEQVEILSGLEGGEQVVANPAGAELGGKIIGGRP